MQVSLFDCPPAGENEPSYVVAHSDDSGQQAGTGNETRKGRPRVHATNAAKVRAHRAKLARLDVAIKPEIAATIKQISGDLDCSANELLNSLIRFALTNRNWKQVGLYGSKGLQ